MKTKSLSKFTRKTGISCFFIPSVPNTIGLFVSGVNQSAVELMTVKGKRFNVANVETNLSEEGRAKVLGELNEVTKRDGGFFAPVHNKLCRSRAEFTYEVHGDVTLANYFGDSFLHVGNGKAKLHVINKSDGKLVNKIKLPAGVRVFLEYQGVSFKVTTSDNKKSWKLDVLGNAPLIDMAEMFINRKDGTRARIKEKHWTRLPNGSFLAVNKTKVNFYTGDKKHSQYVSAGTVFHPEDNMEREDDKLFFELSNGHVCLTKDFVKVDYLIETNLVAQVAKANRPKKDKVKKPKSKKHAKKAAKQEEERKQRKAEKKAKKQKFGQVNAAVSAL